MILLLILFLELRQTDFHADLSGVSNHFHPGLEFLAFEMTTSSFLDTMLSHLRETSRYYTGYPKEFGLSRIIHFSSERQFIQLLHEGQPVVVAFTIKCPYTKHFDTILEEAAAEFYPNIRFVRVECPKYPGFCIARQRKDYPFIEIFHSPEEVVLFILSQPIGFHSNILQIRTRLACFWKKLASVGLTRLLLRKGSLSHTSLETSSLAASQPKVSDTSITKYSVKVLPFNYDVSPYGFREFFKKHGMLSSNNS